MSVLVSRPSPTKEIPMRLALWLVAFAILLTSCTATTPEKALINDAASALGGADRIRAVNTLILEGTGENGNLGQNVAPDAALPMFTVNEYKRALDLTKHRARLEQTRTARFITGNSAPQK